MRSRLDYGAWISYVIERFTGFEEQGAKGAWGAEGAEGAIKPGSHKNRRDRQTFPEVYAEVDREMFAGGPRPMGRPIVGRVTYRGHDALQTDIENLRAAVGADLEVGRSDQRTNARERSSNQDDTIVTMPARSSPLAAARGNMTKRFPSGDMS